MPVVEMESSRAAAGRAGRLGNGLDVGTERGRSMHDPGLTCTGGARCHLTEAGKRDRRDWDVILCVSAIVLSVYMY